MTVQYRDGLPVVTVPLPSRRESCEFTLKPISHTVADFLQFIREEDGGIDRVAVYKEGKSPLGTLLHYIQLEDWCMKVGGGGGGGGL